MRPGLGAVRTIGAVYTCINQKFCGYPNQFEGGVDVHIGNLKQLRHLFLGNNQLTGPLPNSINQLSQLVTLRMEFNYLSGTLPKEIPDLKNLSVLRLDHNTFKGSIPLKLKARESEFQVFDLSNNEFDE